MGTVLAITSGMRQPNLTVADLMSTAVMTIRTGEPIREAHAEMEMGGVRHLPVIDDRGRLAGIVSDRDLLKVALQRTHKAVDEVMTHGVETVTPETPAAEAALLMLDRRISSLPVVDEGGVLVGVVTTTDLVELARRALLGLPLARD